MQPEITTQSGNCQLQGTWDITRAIEGQQLLAGELDLLRNADPGPSQVTLDLNGLTALDASGCQLLAVFLGNLKRYGIAFKPGRIPPEIAEQIRLLGFAAAFTDSSAAEKEIA